MARRFWGGAIVLSRQAEGVESMRGFPRIRTHGLGHASNQWQPSGARLSTFLSSMGSVPDTLPALWISAHRIIPSSLYASWLLPSSGVLVCHTA